VQDGAAEGQALLPTSGKCPGQTAPVVRETGHTQHPFLPILHSGTGNIVDTTIEVDVLLDGQVFVEGEFLAHVTDVRFDGLGLSSNVQASYCAASTAGAQEAAQHADSGGFPSAVRPKESEHFARFNGQTDAIDRHEGTEAFF